MIEEAGLATWLAGAALAVALLALFLTNPLRRWRHRRRRRQQDRLVLSVAVEGLRDVALPDGEGGFLHLDYLLLTPRGLLVIDLRDVPGMIFGGEHMREWTVINGAERATFLNPTEPMLDRLAALRLVVPEVPVDGRIVFTEQGSFPKGRPPQVLMLASLPTEFPVQDRQAGQSRAERWRPAWEALKASLQSSPLGRR